MNGDSFCRVNLRNFLDFHLEKNALVSLVLTRDKKNRNCGFVELDSAKGIVSFNEKRKMKSNSFVSAGIYLFHKKVFSHMPERKKFSLEYDLFPKLADKGGYGYLVDSTLVDIGTPRGLKQAERYFKRFKSR